MLRNKVLLALTLAAATIGAASMQADDRLLEQTPYGWYYSRSLQVDGRITNIERSGSDYVLYLTDSPNNREGYVRFYTINSADVRIGTNKNAHASDLRIGDTVRIIGRAGANGTMFARRVDVTSTPTTRRRH